MVEHILDVGYLLWILFALENKAWVNKYSFLLHKLINKSILCVCQWSRNFKANLLTGKSCRHDLSQDTVQLECWVLPQFHKSWVILLLSFALSTEIICYKLSSNKLLCYLCCTITSSKLQAQTFGKVHWDWCGALDVHQ